MLKFDVTADDLLRLARENSGFSDLGDERFLPAFRKMVDAINAESIFSTEGRDMALQRFRRVLVNRLRAEADFKAHPEILDEVIRGCERARIARWGTG